MSKVVIFKSKTGFTRNYAEWIAEELGADIYEAAQVNIKMLDKYDTIIYGGGLYAVGINGVKLITSNFEKLKDKKLIVFSTGLTPWREDAYKKVKNNNFTKEQQEKIDFFLLRGGFNFSKLGTIDKIIMNFMKMVLKKKKELNSDEKGMLAVFEKPVDWTNKKNIEPIIEKCK